MSALAQTAPGPQQHDEPEVPEPINPVPAIMLGVFVLFAVGMAAIGAYATFHDQDQVGLFTVIATLLALPGYQSWVIARQRRTITHLTLSVDGLLRVISGHGAEQGAGERP